MMSDTPKLADECKKLLDNKAAIILFRNHLGSYSAMTMRGSYLKRLQRIIDTLPDEGNHITDDFEPSQALYRLAEKQIGNIVGG